MSIVMNRRNALSPAWRLPLAAVGAPALTACGSARVRSALFPAPAPRDRNVVFQALLRGQPAPAVTGPDSAWQSFVEAPSRIEADGDRLRLIAEPGRLVWVSPRLPVAPLVPLVPRQFEELSWTAEITVDPDRRYVVLCELRFAGEPGAVLLQPTPFDVQLTLDSERPNGGASTSLPLRVADGRPNYWRLRFTEARTELLLNSTTVWTLEGRHALARVAFGETRSDALHGGRLVLRDVVYVRRPALPGERTWPD
jgi:hypothetical protein